MSMRPYIDLVEGSNSSDLGQAINVVTQLQKQIEEAQWHAQEMLTRWFEQHLKELATRYPKRKFHASSGMGSLSVDITDEHGKNAYTWVWRSDAYNERGVSDWSSVWKPWEKLLDDFADRTALEYVNFTRDVTIKGVDYKGK